LFAAYFRCLKLAASAEVAFSPGLTSTSLRTYGTSEAIDNVTDSGSPTKYFAKEQIRSRRSSAATEDQNDTSTIDVTDNTINESARKIKGEYKEPWVRMRDHCHVFYCYLYLSQASKHLNIYLQDYNNSNYPITLPLRKPNSGNPGLL